MKLPKLSLPAPLFRMLLRRGSHLTTPLWKVLKNPLFKRLQTPFMRLSYKIALVAILIYAALVGGGAYAIYHQGVENGYTRFAERIFPYPVAYVNGQTILLSRFRIEVESRKTWATTHNQATPDTEIIKFVAKQLAQRSLYEQAAHQNKITIEDSEINNQIQSSYNQMGGQDKLAQFLTSNYGPQASINFYETWIREKVVRESVEQTLLEQITLKHILIATPENATPEVIAAAKAKALTVKAELTDLAKFNETAAKYSNDVTSKDNGGQLGTTFRGNDQPVLSAEFEQTAFSLPLEQLSDPVFSPNGWHLIVVVQKTGSIPLSRQAYAQKLWSDAQIKLLIGG